MFELQALGIDNASILMLVMLLGLLLTGLPLAFVTALVSLFFALGWFGLNAVPNFYRCVHLIL